MSEDRLPSGERCRRCDSQRLMVSASTSAALQELEESCHENVRILNCLFVKFFVCNKGSVVRVTTFVIN